MAVYTPEPQTAQDAPWLRGPSLNPVANLIGTVALTKFASRSFPAKVHLKKNPEVEKLR